MSCEIFFLSSVTGLALAAAVLVFRFFTTKKALDEEQTIEIKVK